MEPTELDKANLRVDVLYGGWSAEREVSLATGEFHWQRRSPAMGKPLLTATGPLFLFEDGTLQQFDGAGKAVGDGVVVAGNDVWTVPTLVDQVLYVRDRENISAFRVGPKVAAPASGGAAP